MILVWDTTVSTPVKTIFDPHDEAGVIAMEMTQDAMYLVTLGAGEIQLGIFEKKRTFWGVRTKKPRQQLKTNVFFFS